MTTNGFRPAHALVIAGISLIGVLAVVFSAEVAGVVMGAGLLVLAALRRAGIPSEIVARSTRFDVAFLLILGVGILLLTLTADNI